MLLTLSCCSWELCDQWNWRLREIWMENSMFLHASRLPDPPNQGSPQTTHPPPPDARLQFGPPSLRLFLLFIFSPVFSKCRSGLLASMERFGGRSVMVWVSFLWLFGSKWDLWKRVFYYSKTLLFEVWGGSWFLIFLHCVFASLLLRYFLRNCADLLILRVSMGFQMCHFALSDAPQWLIKSGLEPLWNSHLASKAAKWAKMVPKAPSELSKCVRN